MTGSRLQQVLLTAVVMDALLSGSCVDDRQPADEAVLGDVKAKYDMIVWVADMYLEAGKLEEAAKYGQIAVDEAPSPRDELKARVALATILWQAGNEDAAREQMALVAEKTSDEQMRAEALLALARHDEARREDLLREVTEELTTTSAALDAARALATAAPSGARAPYEDMAEAERYYADHDAPDIAALFAFAAAMPGAPTPVYQVGDAETLGSLELLASRYPGTFWADEAHRAIGDHHMGRTDWRKALDAYADIGNDTTKNRATYHIMACEVAIRLQQEYGEGPD